MPWSQIAESKWIQAAQWLAAQPKQQKDEYQWRPNSTGNVGDLFKAYNSWFINNFYLQKKWWYNNLLMMVQN